MRGFEGLCDTSIVSGFTSLISLISTSLLFYNARNSRREVSSFLLVCQFAHRPFLCTALNTFTL